MKTIVTLTMNPAIDTSLEIPQLLPDRKLRALRPLYTPGGGGVNVSRAIRNLGGTSTAIYLAGGATGQQLGLLLTRESIDIHPIATAEPTREDINIFERATSKEYRIVVPGPEMSKPEWEQALQIVRTLNPRPDYLVASGSLPPGVPVDFFGRLAAIALESNFRLIIDTSGEPLRAAAARGTFLLKPNVHELSYAAGEGVLSDTLIEAASRAIVTSGRSEVVVVSAGAAGAWLTDRHGTRRIPAPMVPISSRVGAGDSMVAGIVLALARGSDIDDAARFGVAAGSAAITVPGHHLCRRDQTERLFEEMQRAARAAAAAA
ncbi:MAG TPA: 1-phosphofructokinase family hexose kinase [Thermoanaerobaculia bacterium]|nr:1-phosphofructokinase family hexose kinase [Thermoanaerobaculia bacterium]